MFLVYFAWQARLHFTLINLSPMLSNFTLPILDSIIQNPQPPITMASTCKLKEDQQKTLECEIRNMVSTLMHRLSSPEVHPSKHGSSPCLGDVEEGGSKLISLAGHNTGAVMMRTEPREKLEGRSSFSDDQGMQRAPGSYANSSYQAVNNSLIMMSGTYSAQDPGIHNVFAHHKKDDDHEKKKKKKTDSSEEAERSARERKGYSEPIPSWRSPDYTIPTAAAKHSYG